MRWSAVTGSLALAGCFYAPTGSVDGGESTFDASTSEALPTEGTSGAATSGSSSGSTSGSSGVVGVCGDGAVDGAEECDDGNVEYMGEIGYYCSNSIFYVS